MITLKFKLFKRGVYFFFATKTNSKIKRVQVAHSFNLKLFNSFEIEDVSVKTIKVY